MSKSSVEASSYLCGSKVKDAALKFMAFRDGRTSTLTEREWKDVERSVLQKDPCKLVDVILTSPVLQDLVTLTTMTSESVTRNSMGNRKHGYVSKLMMKGYSELVDFDWMEVVDEAFAKFPQLMQLALGLCLKEQNLDSLDTLRHVVPKLGMVYAILMQEANQELSRVQRLLSLVLYDNICDQKVGYLH